MNKREVVRMVFAGEEPPYVPWDCQFTVEPLEQLIQHYGSWAKVETELDNHFVGVGSACGFFDDLGSNRYRDLFGVIWDRTVDKDIGAIEGTVLPEASLKKYTFPDPLNPKVFKDIPSVLETYADRFRIFGIGFSLFERAWAMRGMENLMLDFIEHPEFVHELFTKIADYNIAQVQEALKYDIDAVYFGDDWGQQNGLIMGKPYWMEFIYPQLKRMYGAVRDGGKYIIIHSCGKVDELFDDLVELGLNCFNPFQPEVMEVEKLLNRYRGRISFHGGLSTQKTLPYGTPDEVRQETRKLLDLGRQGGYIFSPAHAVEGDVPLENILAFIEEIKMQKLDV